MASKREFPPGFVRPGETLQVEADDGLLEIVGLDNDEVLDFIEAYSEMRMLRNTGMQPSNATFQYAERKIERAWNALPNRVFMEIERRREDIH